MIAVIFEVWPHPDRKQDYLDIAAALRASKALSPRETARMARTSSEVSTSLTTYPLAPQWMASTTRWSRSSQRP